MKSPELGGAVLRQAVHDGRPHEPEIGSEEPGRKTFVEAFAFKKGLGGQEKAGERQFVRYAQAEILRIQNAGVAAHEPRLVIPTRCPMEFLDLVLQRARSDR